MGIFNNVKIRGAGPRLKRRQKLLNVSLPWKSKFLMIPMQRDAKVGIFQFIHSPKNEVFFTKSFLRNWSQLLKKSLVENFIFCAALFAHKIFLSEDPLADVNHFKVRTGDECRLITGLFPHLFLELETSSLEFDFPLGELGEWPPLSFPSAFSLINSDSCIDI